MCIHTAVILSNVQPFYVKVVHGIRFVGRTLICHTKHQRQICTCRLRSKIAANQCHGGWAGLLNQLGANPAEALIRGLGEWTLRFLCLVLLVTPLLTMRLIPALLAASLCALPAALPAQVAAPAKPAAPPAKEPAKADAPAREFGRGGPGVEPAAFQKR